MKNWLEKIGLTPRGGKEAFRITEPFALFGNQTTQTICFRFDLEAEAQAFLEDDPPPHVFVERLVRAGYFIDAVRFLTHGLPEREAIRWACLCVRQTPLCCDAETAVQALLAAEAWVQSPDEHTRAQALLHSEKQNFEMPGAPAAWAVTAAAWARETNPNPTEQPAEKYFSANAAAGAIALAASADMEQAKNCYNRFLSTGAALAQGKT